MRTARSSSRLLGERGRCLPQCMLGYTHPGCGPGYPPCQTPQIPPNWVWAWRLPWPDPSTSPLGVGLETCKACWDTTPPDRNSWHTLLKNITLPPTSLRAVKTYFNCTVAHAACADNRAQATNHARPTRLTNNEQTLSKTGVSVPTQKELMSSKMGSLVHIWHVQK